MSAHDAVTVSPEPSPPTQRRQPEDHSNSRVQLRALSFAQAETALAPPPPLDEGAVQKEEAPTATTDEVTPTALTTEGGGGGDGEPQETRSEEQEVAETHAMTLEVLEDKILELSGSTKKVFASRKKKKAANFAKEIFFFLRGADSQTITAAWRNVKADCPDAFADLIKAIGYKDAARMYPREARATLAAHDDLGGFAEGCYKQNPYAAAMAVSLMPEADRAAFAGAHPGFDSELSQVDRESLAADAFFGKEQKLRKDEEAYRKRQHEGQASEDKDAAEADAAAQSESGKKLGGEVQGLIGAGKWVEVLVLIGGHTSEAEARAAVRQMDAAGQVTALLDALSFDEKWNTHPQHMRRLLALRSADANLKDAHALFPDIPRKANKKGKTKGAHIRKSPLTSAQAYAIFQFMKALPAAHREQFQKAYPALWEEMNVHMNASMKEADDTNFVGAHGEGAETVTGLLVQLEDPQLWLGAPLDRLRGTLELVLAAGHRTTIGERLHGLAGSGDLARLYQDAARRGTVEGVLGLSGDPAQIPADGSPDDRAAAWLGCLALEQVISSEDDKPKFRVFKALGALTHANQETRKEIREEKKDWREAKKNGEEVGDKPDRDKPSLVKQAFGRDGVKVENLAVDELEDMTKSSNGKEDFFGLDFADIDRSGKDDEQDDRNRVDAEYDAHEGKLVFKAPSLELDAARFLTGDLLIQTGPVVMQDLFLDVRWPTPGNPGQKQRVIAKASLIDARGITITGPKAMASIAHVGANGIDFRLEEEDVDYSDNPDANQILALVAKHNPARGLINSVMSGRMEASTQELAAYLGGFPGGAQGGIQLELGGLVVEGIQLGADKYIDKAAVSGVALTYDTRPSMHFEARRGQLGEMIDEARRQLASLPEGTLSETDAHKKGRLEGDIDRWSEEQMRLAGEIPQWQAKEQLYQDIFELHRLLGADAAKSTTDTRVKLMRERAAALGYDVPEGTGLGDILAIIHQDLAHHAGATVSVEEVSVKGVALGNNEIAEANVSDIDVSGEGDALASSLDAKTIKRLGGAGSQDKAGNYVASEVSADVGQVEVKGVSIGGGAPMAALLVKTRDRYRALEKMSERKPADQKLFDALAKQWAVVLADGRSYGEVAEHMAGLWELHGADIQKDAKLLSELEACEKALSGHPITIEAISVAGISVQSGTSQASASTLEGQPVTSTDAHSKVSIGEVEVGGVSTGTNKVGSVTATGISAEADVDLLSDPKGLLKPDAAEVEANVESLRAKDIESGGTDVGEVGVEELSLTVESGPEGSSVALDIGKVYARGVGVEQGKKTAEAKAQALRDEIGRRQENGEPYADLESQLHAIEDGLAKYTAAYADQERILGEVKTIEGHLAAQQKRLEQAKKEAAVIEHKNPQQAAKADKARIASIQDEIDRLKAQRADKKKELTAPQQVITAYESSLGLEGEAALEDIHVAVSGLPSLEQVMKAASGDASADLSGTYGLELSLGPLTIPALDYAAPEMRVALGGATLAKLTADAKVTVEKVPAEDGKPASHQIKSLEIAKFAIPTVSGSNLKLVMGVEGEQIQIELPTVSLKGLSLEGVVLPGLDAAALKTAEGRFEIEEISAAMSAKVGNSMQANGNLSLKGLHAEALSSGAVDFGLGDLTLDKLGFEQIEKKETKGGGGSIVSQILAIGGKATRLGKLSVEGSYDRTTSELTTTVGLGDLTLSGIDYSGGGAHLGVGYAAMKGVSATVAAKLRQGDVPAGESKIESLYLSRLHIDSLAGKNIDYLGKGKQTERFGDGSVKVTDIEQHIGLKAGTLRGIDVGRMRLDGGGDKSLSLSLASGKVSELDLWMKKNGKQVLSTKASATVEGISVSMVDDDLKLGITKFTGSANVKLGEQGNGQTTVAVDNATVSDTQVAVNDMGKSTQSVDATIADVSAKQIDFGTGVKGSNLNTAHGLAGAQLKGITLHDDHKKTTVRIASGWGGLVANAKVMGANQGNTKSDDPDAQKGDEFRVPMYKVDYDISALDKLNGTTKLLYPDGKTFLQLDIVNGVLKLDVTDNIRQMWSSWWQDIKGEDLASWGFDMEAWGKRIQAIRDLDDNAFYTLLLKGAEVAFNNWGESLTGGWSNIAESVVEMLNADPKTTLFEAEPTKFMSFQDSLNKAMKDYVDVGIAKVLDYGMLYDLGKGEYGRAASDAGLWLVEWFGDAVGWDDAEDWAKEKRDAYEAQREAELRKIVANFVGYITSGGLDLKLGSKDGKLAAQKRPLAGGAPSPLLSSLLDIDVAGGGSLEGGISATALGTLREFHFSDAGTSIDMTKLKFGASAKGQGDVDFDEKTSRFSQADLELVAGTLIEFEGLRFERDKSYARDLPEGVTSKQDNYAEHGDNTSAHGPVADGNTIRYDAGQYSEMMLNGGDPVGPSYTTELDGGDKIKSKLIGVVSDTWAEDFASKTIAAQNAEVFGKYAPKTKAAR